MKGRQTTAADLIAQAAANSHKWEAHKEQDEIRHPEKHVKKTGTDQDATLKRYVMWGQQAPHPTAGNEPLIQC
jgi:hypothetical protein